MNEKYTFKLKYEKAYRSVKFYDQHNCWIGTVYAYADKNAIYRYIDHSHLDEGGFSSHLANTDITLDVIKRLAIVFASNSGIDNDIIQELEEDWTTIDFECIGFKMADIIYSDDKIDDSIDTQIFNMWMKK